MEASEQTALDNTPREGEIGRIRLTNLSLHGQRLKCSGFAVSSRR